MEPDQPTNPTPAPTEPAPSFPKPSPGRIVHFCPPQEERTDKTLDLYPAIITQVNEDQSVELATFGPNSLYFQHNITHSAALRPGSYSWPAKV